jgi:hypothetical protein
MLSPGKSLLPKHMLRQAKSRRQIHSDLVPSRIINVNPLDGVSTLDTGDSNTLPVNLTPGLASSITIGGNSVNALSANIAVGIITNPANPNDQGIGFVESLFVNPYGNATLSASGTTFELKPGQSWFAIPYQTTITTVNAATSGHQFTCVQGTNP